MHASFFIPKRTHLEVPVNTGERRIAPVSIQVDHVLFSFCQVRPDQLQRALYWKISVISAPGNLYLLG
jgi:hypothetical protein